MVPLLRFNFTHRIMNHIISRENNCDSVVSWDKGCYYPGKKEKLGKDNIEPWIKYIKHTDKPVKQT
jgi:hypothetical protein